MLELFSGIGGMHHALNLLGDVEVRGFCNLPVKFNLSGRGGCSHGHQHSKQRGVQAQPPQHELAEQEHSRSDQEGACQAGPRCGRHVAALPAPHKARLSRTDSLEIIVHANHPKETIYRQHISTGDLPLLVKLRQGKQRDTEDPRSSPLSHLSDLLPSLPSLKFLLLENVAGFETSKARNQVCESVLLNYVLFQQKVPQLHIVHAPR